MPRVKAGAGRAQRFEVVGTENASDLFGRVIDAVGRDPRKGCQPFGTAGVIEIGIPSDRVGHRSNRLRKIVLSLQ